MDKFNEHILLVMRWLQNNDLVSKKELFNSYRVAANPITRDVAFYAGNYAAYYAADSIGQAAYFAYATADAAFSFNSSARSSWLTETKKHLNKYFEMTKEDRGAYEKQAEYLNVLGAKNG